MLDLSSAVSSVEVFFAAFSSLISVIGSITAGLTTGAVTFFAGVLRTAVFTVAAGAVVFAAGLAGAFVAVDFAAAGFAAVVVLAGAALAAVVLAGAAGAVFVSSAAGFTFSAAGESVFSGVISSGLFSIY
ncbi:hypothetical protein [Flavobacterium johnsoniae]|uniref:hypothetical protein n=1 Tax=Flavobacterium johnsoniae TaxID=986 RepID=UPI001F362410|nr:hypothetical protein [Flavobacterium johnsoniae]WQG80528.1 hypothetical protein SR927_21200 [Flavobacterium johnsoniae UW101]